MTYKAKQNEILDETGKQVAVVLPSNGLKSMARRMAQYVVDRLNADERGRRRWPKVPDAHEWGDDGKCIHCPATRDSGSALPPREPV